MPVKQSSSQQILARRKVLAITTSVRIRLM